MLSAKLESVSVEAQRQAATVRLIKALGGGWQRWDDDTAGP
jgi:outer membrane protein TolC